MDINDEVIIKRLREIDLKNETLENLNRYQETTRIKYISNGKILEKDESFIDEWDKDRKIDIVKYLVELINRQGIVIGAYIEKKLIGFVSIESEFFGSKNQYLELTFAHVSRDYRGLGIGKKLIDKSKKESLSKGAKKLYLGTHPSIESQGFYKKIGCVLAEEINKEVYHREPLDLQLELILY